MLHLQSENACITEIQKCTKPYQILFWTGLANVVRDVFARHADALQDPRSYYYFIHFFPFISIHSFHFVSFISFIPFTSLISYHFSLTLPIHFISCIFIGKMSRHMTDPKKYAKHHGFLKISSDTYSPRSLGREWEKRKREN